MYTTTAFNHEFFIRYQSHHVTVEDCVIVSRKIPQIDVKHNITVQLYRFNVNKPEQFKMIGEYKNRYIVFDNRSEFDSNYEFEHYINSVHVFHIGEHIYYAGHCEQRNFDLFIEKFQLKENKPKTESVLSPPVEFEDAPAKIWNLLANNDLLDFDTYVKNVRDNAKKIIDFFKLLHDSQSEEFYRNALIQTHMDNFWFLLKNKNMTKDDLMTLASFMYYIQKYSRDFEICKSLTDDIYKSNTLQALVSLDKYEKNHRILFVRDMALEKVMRDFFVLRDMHRLHGWPDNAKDVEGILSLSGERFIAFLQLLGTTFMDDKEITPYNKYMYTLYVHMINNEPPITLDSFIWIYEECPFCASCEVCVENKKCNKCSDCNGCRCNICDCKKYKFYTTESKYISICPSRGYCWKCDSCPRAKYCKEFRKCRSYCDFCNFVEICDHCNIDRPPITFKLKDWGWMDAMKLARKKFKDKLGYINFFSNVYVIYVLRSLFTKFFENKNKENGNAIVNALELLHTNKKYIEDVYEIFNVSIMYLLQFKKYARFGYQFDYWVDIIYMFIRSGGDLRSEESPLFNTEYTPIK